MSIHLKKGTVTRLSLADGHNVKHWSEEKMRAKIARNMRISNHGFLGSSIEKEYMSIASELAFCRLIGIDDITLEDAVNNRPYDFKVCGKTIDVKSSKYPFPILYVPVERPKSRMADIFLIIRQVDRLTYEFCGSASKDDLVREENRGKPHNFFNDVYWLDHRKTIDLIL